MESARFVGSKAAPFLKRHNSIQHAVRAMLQIVSIMPIAFPLPALFATFASTVFSFLNLSNM